ncbi:hypothetical protein LINPERHAP1_LOCUS20172, partial [Linum perenne]
MLDSFETGKKVPPPPLSEVSTSWMKSTNVIGSAPPQGIPNCCCFNGEKKLECDIPVS